MIRKILIIITLLFSSTTLFAQWAVYENVPSINELELADRLPSQSITGYVYTNQGWLKVPMIVKASRNFVLVVGYKNVDSGGAYATYTPVNPSNSCSRMAKEVNEISIRNTNF